MYQTRNFRQDTDSLTDSDLNTGIGENLDSGLRDETRTKKEGLLGGIAQLGLNSGDERRHIVE